MPPPPDNDDVLREILIRLPVESLVRSRAVCKRWRAVIDEPPFGRAHQHQPINKSIILIRTNKTKSTCYSLDLEALSFNSNEPQTIAATPLDFSRERLWSAVGACKGLVLTEEPLEIWNPLTQERLDLPTGHAAAKAAFGLGYDYVTDDYKAVSIVSAEPHRTDVYSLKSDSWRTITNCPRDPILDPGVFVCGALNWLSKSDEIIALDLGTEKFTLIQVPRLRRNYQFRCCDATLDVLGGCLILCDSTQTRELDVWVMKDYGVKGSWILLFSIEKVSRSCGCLCLVGFIMKQEEEEDKMRLQVFLQGDFQNFLFDVETETRKIVDIHGSGTLSAQQPGSKFCLRDNCGGARPKTSSSTTTSFVSKKLRTLFWEFCI